MGWENRDQPQAHERTADRFVQDDKGLAKNVFELQFAPPVERANALSFQMRIDSLTRSSFSDEVIGRSFG